MSTQAYYKDRLGFDPNEALNDGSTFDKSQQGYEENLSKFKGLWDLFIDSSGGTYIIFDFQKFYKHVWFWYKLFFIDFWAFLGFETWLEWQLSLHGIMKEMKK